MQDRARQNPASSSAGTEVTAVLGEEKLTGSR